MTGELGASSPDWDDRDHYYVATAIVSLGRPRSNPSAPSTLLYLEIEEDDDEPDEYRWRFGISEEEAGFGEAEFAYGQAPDVEQAKGDCWGAVIDFLRGEGYADEEIARSVQ